MVGKFALMTYIAAMAGIILCMPTAIERRRYNVTSSLIDIQGMSSANEKIRYKETSSLLAEPLPRMVSGNVRDRMMHITNSIYQVE